MGFFADLVGKVAGVFGRGKSSSGKPPAGGRGQPGGGGSAPGPGGRGGAPSPPSIPPSVPDNRTGILPAGSLALPPLPPGEYFQNAAHWINVVSSNLLQIAWVPYADDPNNGTFGVRFHKHGAFTSEYRYSDVPLRIWRGLLAASSKGRYHYYVIRYKFVYVKVR